MTLLHYSFDFDFSAPVRTEIAALAPAHFCKPGSIIVKSARGTTMRRIKKSWIAYLKYKMENIKI